MSDTLDGVRACASARQIRVSRHGSEELDDDGIDLDEIVTSAPSAEVVEDYPSAQRGASVLALHRLHDGRPVHVVWAFHKGITSPAVLVTAYRPDPARWSSDFRRRRS